MSNRRLYFYVEFAFACALLIFAIFFVEETAYVRKVTEPARPELEKEEKEAQVERIEALEVVPPRKPYLQTLKPWTGINRDAEYFMTIARSFTYFLVPSVLWVTTSFGENP